MSDHDPEATEQLLDPIRGRNAFQRAERVDGGSSRTLSQTLDALQEAGLVERQTEEAAPIAVYYALSGKGAALEPVFDELDAWAQEWVDPTKYEV